MKIDEKEGARRRREQVHQRRVASCRQPPKLKPDKLLVQGQLTDYPTAKHVELMLAARRPARIGAHTISSDYSPFSALTFRLHDQGRLESSSKTRKDNTSHALEITDT